MQKTTVLVAVPATRINSKHKGFEDKTQRVLNEFKRKVQTPAGVKEFFEQSSDILTFRNEDGTASFDIVSGGERFIYGLSAADAHKIGMVVEESIIVFPFTEDTYFRKFLEMLSEAIDVSKKVEV